MQLFWIWLATRPGMGAERKRALLEMFSDPQEIYRETEFPGVSSRAVKGLRDKDLSGAEELLRRCEKSGVEPVSLVDREYPRRLREVADAPVVLYRKGTLPREDTAWVGVVGTRRATLYGMDAARQLSMELARCGGVVVTGMAAGVDSAAAEGALRGHGPVVGVLGCGADQVYPAENRQLYRRVVEEGGCLLSEYPPGASPRTWSFPQRNRIISGVSDAVAVTEAPERSGALITARMALEQGREVFAVPGNLGQSACAGSNALLRDGAQVVLRGWDILREYVSRYPGTLREAAWEPEHPEGAPREEKKSAPAIDKAELTDYSDLSEREKAVLALLDREGKHPDELLSQTELPYGQMLAALTVLEIRGLAKTLPDGRKARN